MTEHVHLTAEQIAQCAEAINNDAYNDLSLQIREHLNNCTDCVGEVMLISEIEHELEGLDFDIKKTYNPKPKAINFSSWQKTIIALSAAASLIWAVIYIVNSHKQNDNLITEQNTQIESNIALVVDSVALKADALKIEEENAKQKNHTLIAAYTPNDHLEKLFLSSRESHRSDVFSIDLPDTIFTKKQKNIHIENKKTQTLFIEITDNKEQVVQTKELQTYAYTLPELNMGLYYYKIFNTDYDLLFIGKLIVD